LTANHPAIISFRKRFFMAYYRETGRRTGKEEPKEG